MHGRSVQGSFGLLPKDGKQAELDAAKTPATPAGREQAHSRVDSGEGDRGQDHLKEGSLSTNSVPRR